MFFFIQLIGDGFLRLTYMVEVDIIFIVSFAIYTIFYTFSRFIFKPIGTVHSETTEDN